MIWTSLSALAVIDLAIVVMAALMITVAWARGMFDRGTTPRLGRVLIASGVAVTACYYLADLVIAVLPAFAAGESGLAFVDLLQTQIRGASALLSVGLISAGFIVIAKQRTLVEEKMRDAHRTEHELRMRKLFEETLGRISRRLLISPHEMFNESVEAALRDVCRYVAAEHMTVVWFDSVDRDAEVMSSWTERDVGSAPRLATTCRDRDRFRWPRTRQFVWRG